MKIAHVVTYVSEDGAFGGPTRVALDQAEALAARGHTVTVYAAAPEEDFSEEVIAGYHLKKFPARRLSPRLGYAGMYAKGLNRTLESDLRTTDVVHVHLARDLVTLPAARVAVRSERPLVLQTHGMIDASERRLATLVDVLMTRRVIAGASSIFTLTDEEDRELQKLGATQEKVSRLMNGIRVEAMHHEKGQAPQQVVFLARLHPRKGAVDFARAASIAAARIPNSEFLLYGPDEGDGSAVRKAISTSEASTRIQYRGSAAPKDVPEILGRASLYVLPAHAEPFGLSIIEALASGTPVLLHETAALASSIVRAGVGATFTGGPGELAHAIEALLSQPEELTRMGAKSQLFVKQHFDHGIIMDAVEKAYNSAVTHDTNGRTHRKSRS